MGLRISVDDFGTGYTSLGYLRRLPISELKIDRSFVSHMATSEEDAVIVRSTIDLWNASASASWPRAWRTSAASQAAAPAQACVVAQGYLMRPVIPAGKLTAWLTHLHGSVSVGSESIASVNCTAAVVLYRRQSSSPRSNPSAASAAVLRRWAMAANSSR